MNSITTQSASNTHSNVWEPLHFLTEMDSDVFFRTFSEAEKAETDEGAFSNASTNKSVVSLNMDDCMTVFGVEKKQGAIQSIFAYHIGSSSDEEEIAKELEDYNVQANQFDLYIIGGNKTSIEEGFLETVRSAVATVFEENSNFVKEATDLNADAQYSYVSVNLEMNGTLTYCRHD